MRMSFTLIMAVVNLALLPAWKDIHLDGLTNPSETGKVGSTCIDMPIL